MRENISIRTYLGMMERFKVVRVKMLYLFFIVVIVQVKGKWATKSKCHNPICMKLIFVTFLQSVHFRDELLAENQLRFDKKTVQKPASKKFLRIQPTHQTSIHFNMRFSFKTLAFLSFTFWIQNYFYSNAKKYI